MQTKMKYALAAIAIATLTACGGGGDDAPVVTNVDAQGFWSGPASTGYTVSAVVLENSEIWGVYTSGSTIFGALYGTAAVTGSNISITGTDFNFTTSTSAPGTLTGTVVARSILALSSPNVTVNLAYSPQYDTPATSAAIAGNWSYTGRSGSNTLVPGSVTIDNAGNFSLSQTGCSSSGSFVPRPGGKNVYNITLTSAGPNCAVGFATLSGVVYLDTTVTPNRFLSLALTPSKNDGLIVLGSKL
jgi:hypothetical protein